METNKQKMGLRWGGGGVACGTTMIIAAFVEGIKKERKRKKNLTGCYTGLAFMKKDTDVNDCEFPPSPPYTHTTTTNTTTPQKRRERKKN